jgi:hypothetical protein
MFGRPIAIAGALLSLLACEKKADEGESTGELTRDECVRMVVRVNQLKNKELGRTNDVERRSGIDSCMAHGTRAQLECVEFARNGGEVERCGRLTR